MTTTIWLILLTLAFGGMATVMAVDWIIESIERAGRTIEAARADVDPAPKPRVTFLIDTSDWDFHVEKALELAEPTPDFRRVK